MSITSYKQFSARNIEFGKLQPRGEYHFSSITYKGQPLIIETPPLITPNGINSEGARNWMDLDLNVNSIPDHQALYDMYKSIDDRCIKECINNLNKWFPKSIDEAFIEEEYKSPLTAGWGNEPASLRVEIVSEQPEDLVDNNGVPISPADVTALSSVVIQMQLLGVWASAKYLGCHWRALVVRANLDHETQGRRRSDSPRRISPPPNRPPPRQTMISKREASPTQRQRVSQQSRETRETRQSVVAPQKKEPVAQVAPVAPQKVASKPSSDETKKRVQEMLKRFQQQRQQQRQELQQDEDDVEDEELEEVEEVDEDELARRLSEDRRYAERYHRHRQERDYSRDERESKYYSRSSRY